MKKSVSYSFSFLILFLCLYLRVSDPVSAQQLHLASDQVKIAYLINFIKHIRWPSEQKKKKFIIAVYDDNAFFKKLKRRLQTRKVKNKRIIVISVDSAKAGKVADILFIPNHQNDLLSEYANEIRGSHTLLVTDGSLDKHNVMINLAYQDDTHAISFEVNKSNVVYEKLEMSAELLLFGGTELDVATLYRETEMAMQVTRDSEAELNKKLISKENELTKSSTRLVQLNNRLQKSIDELAKYKTELKNLEYDLVKQKEKLAKNEKESADKEKELNAILRELTDAKEKYLSQQKAISMKADEYELMAKGIATNKLILEEQLKSLNKQRALLDEQNTELEDRNAIIDDQKATIFITSLLVLITLSISILVVVLFIKNRKTTYKLSKTLTYLEETRDQLVQSEKMASLGSLIAGVAHEINTPLGIAVTSTSLIHEKNEEIEHKLNEKTLTQRELKAHIKIVEQSSAISNTGLERVIVLLNNFKQVAADQVIEEARMINLAGYIDEVISTLVSEMKRSHVQYHFTGNQDIEIVTIPGALVQVITNLVNNSIRHGFEKRDTGNIFIDISYHEEKSEETCIKLVYRDDGQGMSPEVLDKIYNPFFTTKRNRGGTGLGMNIVYNVIVQKLGGNITIQSSEDKGATFTLLLPKELED